MLDTRLYTFGGFNAVAPVYWSQPDAPPRRTSTTTRVRYDNVFGWAFNALAKGQAPLACLIATTLPNDLPGATLIAIEDEGAGLWYAHIFRDGRPIEGEEKVFDDATAFDTHVLDAARSGEITHGAFNPSLAARLPGLWENPTIIEPGTIEPQGVPLFSSPMSLTARARKRLAYVGAGIAASAIVGLGAWAFVSPATAPTPTFVDVHQRKNVETFAVECSAALNAEWPTPLNWQRAAAGCFDTRIEAAPEVTKISATAGAFTVYRLDNGFNPQNARIIARYALDGWPEGHFAFEDTTLTLVVPFENPLERIAVRPRANSILFQSVEEALVGTVETIKRAGDNQGVVIRTKTTPQVILPRIAGITGTEIRSVRITQGVTEIVVGPLTIETTKEVRP